MAYASKSEQRLAGSRDYAGSEGTLNSDSVKEAGDMGDKPTKIWGKVDSGTSKKITGRVESKSTEARITGKVGGQKNAGKRHG